VCEAGFLFFEGKHAFNKKHVVSRNYKRLLHQDDSTKRILQVINPKKYSRFILRIQFEICSLGSEDRSTLAVETQRDQEQHPCQPQQIVIDGSQTAGDVQAFNSATCCTTISQHIGGILASAITTLVFLSRSPITFSGTPKL
jgi:hypothetical protein